MKSTTRFKQLRIVFAIALALLAPATVIYINYVAEQRAFFTRRNFRQLGVISRQVSSRIETLKSIMASIVVSVNAYSAGKGDPTTGGKSDPKLEAAQLKKAALEFVDKGLGPRFRLTSEPTVTESSDSGIRSPRFQLSTSELRSPSSIYVVYDSKPDASTYNYHLEASATFEDVAGAYTQSIALGPQPEFDQVIIALRSTGDVLFQSGKPGLRVTSIAHLPVAGSKADKET